MPCFFGVLCWLIDLGPHLVVLRDHSWIGFSRLLWDNKDCVLNPGQLHARQCCLISIILIFNEYSCQHSTEMRKAAYFFVSFWFEGHSLIFQSWDSTWGSRMYHMTYDPLSHLSCPRSNLMRKGVTPNSEFRNSFWGFWGTI